MSYRKGRDPFYVLNRKTTGLPLKDPDLAGSVRLSESHHGTVHVLIALHSSLHWSTSISEAMRLEMMGQEDWQQWRRSAQRWLTSTSATMGDDGQGLDFVPKNPFEMYFFKGLYASK